MIQTELVILTGAYGSVNHRILAVVRKRNFEGHRFSLYWLFQAHRHGPEDRLRRPV